MMRSLVLVGAKTCLGWLFKERYKVIEVGKSGGYLDERSDEILQC